MPNGLIEVAGTGPQDAQRRFSLGAMAEALGSSLPTLRFDGAEGLLHPDRARTGRRYGRRDRARLDRICRGNRLGFSLAAIREFLELYSVVSFQVEQMAFFCSGRAGVSPACKHNNATLIPLWPNCATLSAASSTTSKTTPMPIPRRPKPASERLNG